MSERASTERPGDMSHRLLRSFLDTTEARFSHLVTGGTVAIDQAHQEGTPVISLCGKRWVPAREPDYFPLCPLCVQMIRTWWAA